MSADFSDAMRDFLNETRFGVAATLNKDGSPQQTIVWYELDGDEVVMNVARGRVKEINLRRDPRLSLCVEDGYRYITMRGQCRLIAADGQRDIERLAARYVGATRAKEMMRTQFSKEERVTVRMKIDKVFSVGF